MQEKYGMADHGSEEKFSATLQQFCALCCKIIFKDV